APRQEYVSPIAQDEDERLLQEIRRQRRRQAYEGTLRTQRRMQDTARMQEILRQQEAAQRAQMQQQAQPAYEQARPMQNYEPMRGEYEQPHHDYEPVRPPYESAAVTYDQAPSREYEQERRISYDREFERPQVRTMQQERMRYEQTYEQMPKAEPSLRQEPVRRGDMTDSIPRMTRSQAQPMRQGQQSTYDAYEASARQQSVQASGRRSMPVEDTHSYNQMLELAADVAQLSGRETVLEIGCGNGELTEVLASRSRFVAVVDTSAYALENCRAACTAKGFVNVDFLEGDARRLPIESASFDVVYVHMLLHHVVSAPQVLVEARRVLKPGGCVVVTELMPSDVPAQQNIQNAIEVLKNPTHIGVLPMDEVMRMMRYAQLEVVDRRVLDQTWEFEQWVDAMGAQERKEPLQALMRSFALQGNRAGMDLTMDKNGRMTFINRWMYLVGVPQK
ncbi:MAG: methyltransferase domain-containing protein, partial [Clostridia bacterium]|nr:methyltransferase domain-containing protein [Clostridia bacterium]